jgi:hypothetical protein
VVQLQASNSQYEGLAKEYKTQVRCVHRYLKDGKNWEAKEELEEEEAEKGSWSGRKRRKKEVLVA